MPKHLQFAQINKKFKSDVNKKLIVQRSELIVSKKKKKSRIEPKQLRKIYSYIYKNNTVNKTVITVSQIVGI